MTLNKVPLVGMYFRPPAQIVLKGLLGGSHLTLTPEPENPYDSNAIRVECNPNDMEPEYKESIREQLEGYGKTLEELLAEPSIHLGYVAKTHTAIAEGILGGVLVFAGDGKPWIELDDPDYGDEFDKIPLFDGSDDSEGEI